MPGTPTPYYGFPIPAYNDPADAPHDFEQLAQKIEDTLKNGYTIPGGSLTVGDKASGTGYSLLVHRNLSSAQYEGAFALTSNNSNSIAMNVGLVGDIKQQLLLSVTGMLQIRDITAALYRPIPFAMWTDVRSLTLTTTAVATVAITLPVGRFTVAPVVTASATHASNVYAGIVSAVSAASVTVGARHIDGTATTSTVNMCTTAFQMTPTAASG